MTLSRLLETRLTSVVKLLWLACHTPDFLPFVKVHYYVSLRRDAGGVYNTKRYTVFLHYFVRDVQSSMTQVFFC